MPAAAGIFARALHTPSLRATPLHRGDSRVGATKAQQKSRSLRTGLGELFFRGLSALVRRQRLVDALAGQLRVRGQAVVVRHRDLALDERGGVTEELEIQADA